MICVLNNLLLGVFVYVQDVLHKVHLVVPSKTSVKMESAMKIPAMAPIAKQVRTVVLWMVHVSSLVVVSSVSKESIVSKESALEIHVPLLVQMEALVLQMSCVTHPMHRLPNV